MSSRVPGGTANWSFNDGTGNYNGKLYATTGTFYSMPWKAADLSVTEVGTASFQPTSPYTARLIYVVTAGSVTVTKLIQRQNLTQITIGGSYIGAQAGAYSGCNSTSNNNSASYGTFRTRPSWRGGAVALRRLLALGQRCFGRSP